jgi:hypothetical protein
MESIRVALAAGLMICGLTRLGIAAPPDGFAGQNTCQHGTAVEFVATPSAAAARAKAEQKLVFVLHVSGHFEDPTFT